MCRNARFAFLLVGTSAILAAACGGGGEHAPSNGSIADAGQVNVLARDCLITSVAMDDASLYVSCGGYSVLQVPKDGSAQPQLLAALGHDSIVGIAVDATDVYFTDLDDGFILSVPKGAGSVRTIATGQLRPWGITLDADRVYWANGGSDSVGSPGNDGSIMAMSKTGGAPTVLAAGEQMPMTITLSSSTLVWGDDVHSVRGLDLASDGGTPTSLASGLGFVRSPLIAGASVYFSNNPDTGAAGLIESVPLVGGASTTVASLSAFDQVPLAADSDFLYFGEVSDQPGAVQKIALAGGPAVQLAPPPVVPGLSGVVTPQFLLVDATRVFVFDWIATPGGDQGVILRYSK